MQLLILLTNCPDEASADRIAEAAVTSRLAAATNRFAPIASLYRWKGQLCRGREVPLLLKTRPDLAEPLVALIRAHHPYETPAILRQPVDGNSDYIAWLAAETRPAGIESP